jgi:hypothetical protein
LFFFHSLPVGIEIPVRKGNGEALESLPVIEKAVPRCPLDVCGDGAVHRREDAKGAVVFACAVDDRVEVDKHIVEMATFGFPSHVSPP